MTVRPSSTEGPLLTFRGVIYPWQCDHMDHLNVMWYVGKFDEATWQLIALLGLPASRLRQEHRGMAAVEQHLTYHREVRAGDTISIYTEVADVRDRVLVFRHRMFEDGSGELAAETEITGVHMDLSERRATAFPDDVLERGRALASGQAKPGGSAP